LAGNKNDTSCAQDEMAAVRNWSLTSSFHPIDVLCFVYTMLKENFITGQFLEVRFHVENKISDFS